MVKKWNILKLEANIKETETPLRLDEWVNVNMD